MQLLTANTADARRGSLEELRKEVTRRGDNPKLAALREAARHLDGSVSTGVETTETHLRAALAASRNLINAFPPQAAETPTSTTLRPLVDQLLSETNAYQVACHRTIQAMEQKAAGHVEHLRSLEFKLFLFVMVVLLLEGLFVISPAVAKLQQIIAEMERSHRELRNYAGKLERSNRELQDFASVASHDLQEPLRKVQAFSDRLVTKYAGVLDEQGRDYLERVQNAARRMQTLINDLLTYSRITTKAMPFVPVDLGTATREVLADLEVRIERTGGRVEVARVADHRRRSDPGSPVNAELDWQRPEVSPAGSGTGGESVRQPASSAGRRTLSFGRRRQRNRLRGGVYGANLRHFPAPSRPRRVRGNRRRARRLPQDRRAPWRNRHRAEHPWGGFDVPGRLTDPTTARRVA